MYRLLVWEEWMWGITALIALSIEVMVSTWLSNMYKSQQKLDRKKKSFYCCFYDFLFSDTLEAASKKYYEKQTYTILKINKIA